MLHARGRVLAGGEVLSERESRLAGRFATKFEFPDRAATGSSGPFGSEVEVETLHQQEGPVESGAGVEPSRPRLLLVEDDWRTHSALRKILARLGWEVHSAMTVSSGLALLDLKPDAVILDLMLPDGDGMAVLRKVRSEQLPTRVAVTTGIEDRARLEEIRKLRPDALLRKPLELSELLRAIGIDGSI